MQNRVEPFALALRASLSRSFGSGGLIHKVLRVRNEDVHENWFDFGKLLRLEPNLVGVSCRLSAVAAVLATSTRFEVEQSCKLDLTGRTVGQFRCFEHPGESRRGRLPSPELPPECPSSRFRQGEKAA